MPVEPKPLTTRQLRTLDDRRAMVADAVTERKQVESKLVEQRHAIGAVAAEREQLIVTGVSAADLRRVEARLTAARSRERELIADLVAADGERSDAFAIAWTTS